MAAAEKKTIRALSFLSAPVLIAVFFSANCASSPRPGPVEIPLPEPPPEERREILDAGVNGPLPEWAENYMRGGVPLVEEMPEFSGDYVFVREDSGTSLAALERLAARYDAEKDFPRLAAIRVLRRFTEMGGPAPPPETGQYQQAAVRAVADAAWAGARRAGTHILRVRTVVERTETDERDAFLLLTLVIMDRASFRGQLEAVLWRQADGSGARRARNSFYDNF